MNFEDFLLMVAKEDQELAIALARRSMENPKKEATTTYNFNEGCGVQTVNVGCTFFEGSAKKAGKKPAKSKTKPSGQKPGAPSPPGGAEPLATPPVDPEEAIGPEEENIEDEDVEEEDIDEDIDEAPTVNTTSTPPAANVDEIPLPNIILI